MKKQITIDGENSDWYEKAIFILKDKEEHLIPNNLFLYAEHIVENHLKKNPVRAYRKEDEKKLQYKKKGRNTAQTIDKFFNISLIVCIVSVVILAVLFYI